MARLSADTDRCIGSGQCVMTDSTVFDQDEDEGTVVLLSEHVEGEQLERARRATVLCPSGALSLAEDSAPAG